MFFERRAMASLERVPPPQVLRELRVQALTPRAAPERRFISRPIIRAGPLACPS